MDRSRTDCRFNIASRSSSGRLSTYNGKITASTGHSNVKIVCEHSLKLHSTLTNGVAFRLLNDVDDPNAILLLPRPALRNKLVPEARDRPTLNIPYKNAFTLQRPGIQRAVSWGEVIRNRWV